MSSYTPSIILQLHTINYSIITETDQAKKDTLLQQYKVLIDYQHQDEETAYNNRQKIIDGDNQPNQ